MIVFQTKRLTIRQLTASDLPGFHLLESDPDVLLYADGEATDEAANEADLAKCIQHYADAQPEFCIWAVVETASTAFLGTCALVRGEDGGHEIGYRFIKAHWGKGFGTEVCSGLIDYCIHTLQLPTLNAHVDSRNTASVRILENSLLALVACDGASESDRLYRWVRDK